MATATATATKTPEQIAAEAQGNQGQPAAAAPAAVNQTVQQQKPAETAAPKATTTAATTGTAPSAAPAPSAAVGSNLPAYAANYNSDWMKGNSSYAQPGDNTSYSGPGDLSEWGNFAGVPGYNAGANGAPAWNQPGGSSQAAYDALQGILGGDGSGMDTHAIKNRLK